ncbi:MAG: DNA polymerase III subunit chi, partial [Pseudomonadota bacterium]|nr:DNA polymerase III subunit chi [Pseudomonadota bacterium]
VPHALAESAVFEPVVIGTEVRQAEYGDVFINLSVHPCQNLTRYQRINEIMSDDPEELQAGRQSYRFYQQQGFQPETHKL